MKKTDKHPFSRKLICLALALLLLAGASLTGAQAQSVPDFADEVLRLVNIERANAGLPPLLPHANLSAAALIRAQEVVTLQAHTRPDGRSWNTVLSDFGIAHSFAGENIAFGFHNPAGIVAAWLESPTHRANILRPEFTHLGVGAFNANGNVYWAQLFITAPGNSGTNTIFNTSWPANPANWVSFFMGFGWVWMWFIQPF